MGEIFLCLGDTGERVRGLMRWPQKEGKPTVSPVAPRLPHSKNKSITARKHYFIKKPDHLNSIKMSGFSWQPNKF